MDNYIPINYLESALAFLKTVLDSPERRDWCRNFDADVPKEFQEEVGEFLLDYRESGADRVFRRALTSLDQNGTGFAALSDDLSSMSDAELEGQLAGLMEDDRPFVLYGMSSGLLYRLYEELLQRRQKELHNGYVCRLNDKDLPEITNLCESLWPGRGSATAELLAAQLHDAEAALFGFLKENELTALAHCRIRRDYVEGAEESGHGVAYLENLFLKDGAPVSVSAGLTEAAGDWAREMGCRELATDCALDDKAGAAMRESAGFAEAARIICYIRKL